MLVNRQHGFPKDFQFNVRISRQLAARIRERADGFGLTVAEWFRRLAVANLEVPSDGPLPFTRRRRRLP